MSRDVIASGFRECRPPLSRSFGSQRRLDLAAGHGDIAHVATDGEVRLSICAFGIGSQTSGIIPRFRVVAAIRSDIENGRTRTSGGSTARER